MAEPRPFYFDSEQRSVGAAGGRRRVAWPWIALSLALHGAIVLFALMGAARGGHTELLGTLEVAIVGAPSAGEPSSRTPEGEADAKPVPDAVPRPQASPAPPSEAAPVPQPPPVPQPATLTPNAPPPETPAAPIKPDTAAPPDPIALPRKAAEAEALPTAPPSASDAAPKRPDTVRPPEPPAPRKIEHAAKAPAAPRREPATRVAEPPPVPKPQQMASLPRAKAPRASAPPAKAAARAGAKQAPKGQTASLGAPTGGDRLGRSDNDDASGLLNVNLNPRFRRPPAPPVYPRQSIERDEEGVVLVRALVDSAGAPRRVVIHKGSGFPLLDEAALKAVSGWRFEPMVRGGRAVAAWVQVPVRFRLN